jgi:hypothetical protein
MKKNLNKKVRLEVYKKMLVIFKEFYARQGFYPWGYCWLLPDIVGNDYSSHIKSYIELYKAKPPYKEWIGYFWFYRNGEGTLKRITLLEKVIAEMEKESN